MNLHSKTSPTPTPTPIFRLLRPKDWIKNLFLFAPLFFTPTLFHYPEVIRILIGAIIFSITASSIYILNDLKDRAADLLHPQKRFRPIASNQISVTLARWLCILLSMIGLIAAALLSQTFFTVVLIYYIINIAYCAGLKRIAIIDVYCVAAGFILRVIAGSELIHVTPSIWILMCTGLLALFLALAKRRDDIVHHMTYVHRESIRGYNLVFIDASIAITLSALLIAYTIYSTLDIAEVHLGTTHFYWTVPLVLFGMLRYLQITLVEEKSDSPTRLLFTDKFLLGTVIMWFVLSAILIY